MSITNTKYKEMKIRLKAFLIAVSALAAAFAAGAAVVVEVPTENIPTPALVTIAVPENYDSCHDCRYPTVYLLNGHGGDHRSWGSIVNLDSLATVHEIVIVCPAGQDSWYFDSPVNPAMKMESYLTKDLIPWIDANYRTIAKADKRAITGLSMGGHGALWTAFRHPELFMNAGSTSGGVDFTPWPGKWNLPAALGPYKSNKRRWRNHTVQSLVPKVPRDHYNIIFDCGSEDFFFGVNNQLHKTLQERGIDHVYLTSPGIHNSVYWKQSILPQLDFFSKHFNHKSAE